MPCTLDRPILPAPGDVVPGRQYQTVVEELVRLADIADCVTAGNIHKNIPSEQSVFVADHGWPICDFDLCEVAQGKLPVTATRNQDSANGIRIVAKIAEIPDVYRITFRSKHNGADIFSINSALHYSLRIFHADAITRQLLAIPFEVKKMSISGALREDSSRSVDGPQQGFHLSADFLNVLQISARDFKAHRGAHPCAQHFNTPADRHCPGVGDAWKLQCGVHLVHQFFGGNRIRRDVTQNNAKPSRRPG